MADPHQKGTQMVSMPTPTFTAFVVLDGTWREAPVKEMVENKDGNSETFNYTFANPGVDASCEWGVKNGHSPAEPGDVVTATYKGGATVDFLVVSVDNSDFGGKILKQSVTLAQRDSCDLGAS